MIKGRIVLVPFPFDDLSSAKAQPATGKLKTEGFRFSCGLGACGQDENCSNLKCFYQQ
jgi:hypothetical protein